MRKQILLLAGVLYTLSVSAQNPNWAEHVAPILYNNCTSCHITGGIAPFSLVGYSNAKNMASGIKSSTVAKRMPPWKADPNYKRYAHERVLSAEEIKTLADWADNSAPQGDLSKAPADPLPLKGTSIVAPDLNLKMSDYLVKTTSDLYRCFVLPTGVSTDKFITQLEIVPGNRKIVHHVLVFWDTTNIPKTLDDADPGAGYTAFGGTGSKSSTLIGLWAPGGGPFNMPTGMGIRIPANANIVLQIHYPANVNNETDSTRVFFKFGTSTMRPILISSVLNHGSNLVGGPLVFPANQVKTFSSLQVSPANATVIAVAPHMHMLGKKMIVYEHLGTDTTKLINIPAWDFHWQGAYFFRNPLKMRNAATIRCEAFYDNTSNNPNNPNSPPKLVTAGEGTTEEMLLVYFWYTLYFPGDENIVIDNSPLKNLTLSTKSSSVLQNHVDIFPNPTNSMLTISGTNITEIELLHADGRKVLAKTQAASKEAILDLTHVSSGMYLVRVKQNQYWSTSRVVKQ